MPASIWTTIRSTGQPASRIQRAAASVVWRSRAACAGPGTITVICGPSIRATRIRRARAGGSAPGLALWLGLAFIVMAWIFAPKNPDSEKLSAYECGFNAFDDARMKFDVRFYLVAILFIIFDLEVAFLFPWAVTLGDMPAEVGQFAFWSMMDVNGIT